MTFKRGSTDPCKQEACDIQTCLKNNHFQQDKCLEYIENLKKCCRIWMKSSSDLKSDCCSGFIKSLKEEEQKNFEKQ